MRINPVSRPPAITQGYYRKNQQVVTIKPNNHQQNKQAEKSKVNKNIPDLLSFLVILFGFGYIIAQLFRWFISF